MGKFWKCILVWLALLPLLTGCWDRRELEERTSVLAIGIDVEEGKEHLYKMTVQIPIAIKIAGSGGGGKGGGGGGAANAVKIMSATGRTVSDASNNLQMRLNQRIFLGHTRILAVSEKVARQGIEDIMDGFRREPQIRRLMWPIVVKGKASSLLELQPQLSQIPVVFLMDLIESGAKMGRIPSQTLGDYFNQTSNKAMEPFLNYVEASKSEVQWRGAAVFRGHKMVGVLDDIETWQLLHLRNEKRGGDVIIPLPGTKGGYVTFRPHFVKTRLDMRGNHLPGRIKDHTSHAAKYSCVLQGDIVELTEKVKGTKEQFIYQMQALIKKEMEKRSHQLLGKLQKEYNSDIMKLGLALRAHHYRDYWVTHNWRRDFRDFPIEVEYTIKLRRLGMEMQ